MLGQLFLAGKLSEGDLLRLVDERRFAAVPLLLPEIGAPVERAGLNRRPGRFVERVRQEYTLILRTRGTMIYEAR